MACVDMKLSCILASCPALCGLGAGVWLDVFSALKVWSSFLHSYFKSFIHSACILAQLRQCHSHHVPFLVLPYKISTIGVSDLCLGFGNSATSQQKGVGLSLQMFMVLPKCCSNSCREKLTRHANKG